MDNPTTTRRRWIQAGAALLPVTSMAAAPAPSRVLGANDRIRVGCVGVGGNGFGMLRRLVERSGSGEGNWEVAAVSDIYTRRKQRARDTAKLQDQQVHHDFHDLIARSDIDAIFISVPDHWHARMALDAMAAGKDVYLQKPMTLTIDEAREVAAAAKRQGRVLQVGSQHLSDPRYKTARELIAAGEIGTLLWAQATYSRNSIAGEWNYFVDPEGTPETIDWKRWLGSAPQRPFSAERYFRWRKYWDYSGGIATDLFYHRLGPVLYSMGARFPQRVSAHGGIYVQKDREVPDTYATTVEYDSFYVTLSSSMANAAANRQFAETIYGNKGTLTFEKDAVLVHAEPTYAGKRAGEAKRVAVPEVDIVNAHVDNFFGAMRERKLPVLNAELGYQIMTAIRLGVDSYREGVQKHFDPATGKVLARAAAKRPGFEGDGKNGEGVANRAR